MFARILEFTGNYEKKDELILTIRQEILPILKKQPGFLELLPFLPESPKEKMVAISLWTEKRHAESYAADAYPRVEHFLKPFISGRITVRRYTIETTLCEHFVDALTTAA